jgi:uncharacterized membrane protein HdeD (DUF308 family)
MATASSMSRSSLLRDDRDISQIGWLWSALAGTLILLTGIAALIWPTMATVAVQIYVGWMLLLGGVFGLFAMFRASGVLACLWSLVSSLLAIAAAVLLLTRPDAGMISLTLVLTIYFFAHGAMLIVAALDYRTRVPGGWAPLLAAGIIDLVLGWAVIAGFPATATWALGVIVGVNLIAWGAALLCFAVAVRTMRRQLKHAA